VPASQALRTSARLPPRQVLLHTVAMPLTWIFFDVGETLVDESRLWRLWAEWLGVAPDALFAALTEVIERREHHRRVFERFRPGFDLARARREREERGWASDALEAADLYPDAVPCLQALHEAGYRIGIAGNQPATTERLFRVLALPVDIIGSSEGWGVEKPALAFFRRLQREAGAPASEIAYVGDRLDADILPALEAGMSAVLLARGPWGIVQARWPEAERATLRVESLAGLPTALRRLDAH